VRTGGETLLAFVLALAGLWLGYGWAMAEGLLARKQVSADLSSTFVRCPVKDRYGCGTSTFLEWSLFHSIERDNSRRTEGDRGSSRPFATGLLSSLRFSKRRRGIRRAPSQHRNW
jgi:hypothetical protein